MDAINFHSQRLRNFQYEKPKRYLVCKGKNEVQLLQFRSGFMKNNVYLFEGTNPVTNGCSNEEDNSHYYVFRYSVAAKTWQKAAENTLCCASLPRQSILDWRN